MGAGSQALSDEELLTHAHTHTKMQVCLSFRVLMVLGWLQ